MNLLDRLLSVIAPMQCLRCGMDGALVCAWCKPDLFQKIPERCIGCKALAKNSKTCTKCRQNYKLPIYVWVCTNYDGYPKQLIHKLKFERAGSAASILADYIVDTLPYIPADTLIIPVPTVPKRIRQRGYDQAYLLARQVARGLNAKHANLLVRMNSARQVGSSRSVRKKQLADAFCVKDRVIHKNTPIILIDDIYTTGGTIIAATSALKKAGYKNVSAAVVAQAV